MPEHAWVKELPIIITVADAEGIITEMNDSSIEYFDEDGGEALIGSDLLNCHPEPYYSKLKAMMETQTTNIYSVVEDGKKKLICQMPWYQDGEYAGFVEMQLEIPDEIPHHAD